MNRGYPYLWNCRQDTEGNFCVRMNLRCKDEDIGSSKGHENSHRFEFVRNIDKYLHLLQQRLPCFDTVTCSLHHPLGIGGSIDTSLNDIRNIMDLSEVLRRQCRSRRSITSGRENAAVQPTAVTHLLGLNKPDPGSEEYQPR
jgi:hypothetical protein